MRFLHMTPAALPPKGREDGHAHARGKEGLVARFCLVVVSVLLAALLCEAALRLLLPKYRNVAEGQLQADELRIYAPAPNSRDWRVHPDTRRRHPFHTNNLALRQHRNFSDADIVAATTVGVFGDSFVQGSYLDAPYVFTEPLDYLLNLDGDFTVFNFGVKGYGPAQSYFTYRSFRAREDLDYVLFVYFSGNDISDLLHNRLFDLDDSGLLRRREVRGPAWWVPFASRLHLTYLALDAVGRLAPYMAAVTTELRTAWHLRKNVPADRLGASVGLFGQLMSHWRREVEESGAKFLVVLLPTQPDFPLVRPLLEGAGVGVVDLNACYESRGEGHRGRWRESPHRLKNDSHWNEHANRLTAACLDSRLRREAGLPAMADATRDAALAAYYAAFDPSAGAPGEEIRRKYQALGGFDFDAVDARIESRLSPDKLVVSNEFDIYLDGSQLVFVKGDCHAKSTTAHLFVQATPVDPSVLPPRESYLTLFAVHDEGRCLAKWDVSDVSNISHVLVGQRSSRGALLWSDEVVIDRAAFEKTLTGMLTAAGEPVIESDMDVHVHGQRIFVVSDDCERTDGRTFFLHVTPVREADLPAERLEHGYDDLGFTEAAATLGERCVVRWHLPDYPILHVHVGQRNRTTGILWSGEVFIDRAGFGETLEDMLAEDGKPLIESDMDVHVHGRRIFYVSDDCQRTDGRTPFFLHVTPVRGADLPPERIEHGYDNLDFLQAGVTIGERCVVRWQLPDYPIRHIRTGQYVVVRDGEEVLLSRVWEGEADIG